jgi:hypothetical protein
MNVGRVSNCETGISYTSIKEAIIEAEDGGIITINGFFDEDIMLPTDKVIHIKGDGVAIVTGRLIYKYAKEGCTVSDITLRTVKREKEKEGKHKYCVDCDWALGDVVTCGEDGHKHEFPVCLNSSCIKYGLLTSAFKLI